MNGPSLPADRQGDTLAVCAICGEPEADAEMFDPEEHDAVWEWSDGELGAESRLVHAECGLAAGWEIA